MSADYRREAARRFRSSIRSFCRVELFQLADLVEPRMYRGATPAAKAQLITGRFFLDHNADAGSRARFCCHCRVRSNYGRHEAGWLYVRDAVDDIVRVAQLSNTIRSF
jgi:hypothetical protein